MIQRGKVYGYGKELNKLLVRIPYFEKAGDRNEAIFECLIAVSSGIIPHYKEGDTVYVDFENNDLDYPVVVSKLLTNKLNYEDNVGAVFAESVNVNGPTQLTAEFKVGDITYKDLYNCKQAVDTIINGTEIIDIWMNANLNNRFYNLWINLSDYANAGFKYLVIEYLNDRTDPASGTRVEKMLFKDGKFNLTNTELLLDGENHSVRFCQRYVTIDKENKKLIFDWAYYCDIYNKECDMDHLGKYLVPTRVYLSNNI